MPFLKQLRLEPSRVEDSDKFPFNIPSLGSVDLRFNSATTLFVGENGSGKSTLLEAIADLSGLPVQGGAKCDQNADYGSESQSCYAYALRPGFSRRPRDGYFFRAENQAYFADLLEERQKDPAFGGKAYQSYGGKSLHHQSHGEAFLSVILNRMSAGMFLLDEPEAALSPKRQLVLMSRIDALTATGRCQFFISTHSPILMTLPGAEILCLDTNPISVTSLVETEHYQVTQSVLRDPKAFWRYVRQDRAHAKEMDE